MTRAEILNKLEIVIDEAIRTRLYGQIELEFRAGEPTFMRTTRQEKLDETEHRYGRSN